MAALRIFARSALTTLRAPAAAGYSGKNAFPILQQTQRRWIYPSNLNQAESTTTPDSQLPDFEISKDPAEWVYVERCLRNPVVPEFPRDVTSFPSGWKPQDPSAKSQRYFVERTKNHMVPVYLHIAQRGLYKVTLIRKIQGDIWLLEKEMKEYVEQKVRRLIGTKVNEPAGLIKFRGDYVSHCKNFLASKGF